MTPAGTLQKHLRVLVEGSGGTYRKMRWEGRVGAPDCFVRWPGARFALVEVKAGKDRYSVLQSRECDALRADGIPVHTVRDVSDVERVVKIVRDGVDSV